MFQRGLIQVLAVVGHGRRARRVLGRPDAGRSSELWIVVAVGREPRCCRAVRQARAAPDAKACVRRQRAAASIQVARGREQPAVPETPLGGPTRSPRLSTPPPDLRPTRSAGLRGPRAPRGADHEPKSGGGKAERFGAGRRVRSRGISRSCSSRRRPDQGWRGRSRAAQPRSAWPAATAPRRLVAAVAARRQIPHVCVPAGDEEPLRARPRPGPRRRRRALDATPTRSSGGSTWRS